MDRRRYAAVAGSKNRFSPASVLGVCLIVLFIASCDSPDDGHNRLDGIDRVGVVLLSQFGPDSAPLGQGSFTELTTPRDPTSLTEPFGSEVGTCSVSLLAGSTDEAPSDDFRTARLNAGDVVLRVDGDDYATLESTGSGIYRILGAELPLPDSGLSLSLAASTSFPAVEGLSIDPGEAPVLGGGFDPDDVRLTSEFTWVPGPPGAVMLLVGSGSGVGFSCLVEDATGTFAFPGETRDALASAGFTGGRLDTLARLATVQSVSGNALLLLGTMKLTHIEGTR